MPRFHTMRTSLVAREAGQRCELIESEGVLAVEFCKPVMFADRIRQGHKLFFVHATYTVEHEFF